MNELKYCPFCGCSMRIEVGTYPNGDPMNELRGWHDDECPLSAVSWYTYPEDGWTEETLTERWNKRIYE
jgi:hypothetical protein